MPTQVIPIEGIDKVGVITDSPAVTLPPGAWTSARNVRFDDNAIRRMRGETTIFRNEDGTSPFTDIQHITYWENPNVRCYVVIDRGSNTDRAFLLTVDGDGYAIMAAVSPMGAFSRSENWTSAQFNGGYSIIINNGIEAPHHITVQLGGTSDINSIQPFEPLPGWDSYLGTTGFFSVSTDIIIPYGNLLVAGALTERSLPQLTPITAGSVVATNSISLTFASGHGLLGGDRFQITNDPNYTWTWTVPGDGSLVDPDVERTFTIASPFNQEYTVTAISGDVITATPTTDFDMATPASSLDLGTIDSDTPYENMVPPFSADGDIVTFQTFDAEDGEAPAMAIVRDLNGVVRTSSVSAPGSIPDNWNPFAIGANTADEINLADAGKITAVRELRGNLFVFTSDTITQLRVSGQGLTQVPITKEYGALTQSGVFGFKGSLLIVGSDDIYTFSGNPGDIQSIVDGRVRNYFYDNLSITTFRNLQMQRNQTNEEIWIFYPTDTDTFQEVLIWNYNNNSWVMRDLPADMRSVTKGPVPGQSQVGVAYQIPNGATSYDLRVTNANGVTTNQPGIGFANAEEVASALNTDINGQSGLVSFIYENDPTILIIGDARLDTNRWTFEITVDGNVIGESDVEIDLTPGDDRDWANNVLNEAQNFIVFAGDSDIYTAEAGFTIGDGMQPARFGRTNLHFAPSKETEMLTALFMNIEDANVTFTIQIDTKDNTRGTPVTSTPYRFESANDYKVDVRKTSRLVDWYFECSDAAGWTIADLSIEVGRGGTR